MNISMVVITINDAMAKKVNKFMVLDSKSFQKLHGSAQKCVFFYF